MDGSTGQGKKREESSRGGGGGGGGGQETDRQTGGRTKTGGQSGRLERANKHEYLYCMDNDMVLEMKAETMQIALTLRQLPWRPTT